MPPAPRRRNPVTAWVLGAALVTVTGVFGVLYQRYYASVVEDPLLPETLPNNSKPRRTGPKSSLTLSSTVLPPPWLIERITREYILHLVLYAVEPRILPDDYSALVDDNRVLFHSTAQGVVHMARALGGTFITVRPGVAGLDPPQNGETPIPAAELPMDKLVSDVKSFVAGVIVVCTAADVESHLRQLQEHPRQVVKVVPGWQGLADALAV